MNKQKALEAACLALLKILVGESATPNNQERRAVEAAISTYLSAMTAGECGELVRKLRHSANQTYDTLTKTDQIEAADTIEALVAEKAELWEETLQAHEATGKAEQRAEAAEASAAELGEALERLATEAGASWIADIARTALKENSDETG